MRVADLLEEFNIVIDTKEGLSELRFLILGLAVRGKLVLQDPNDEPASELLKKIEAEKHRLYEEGKIRKPKNFAEVTLKDSLNNLPINWIQDRLGNLTTVITKGTTPTTYGFHYLDAGINFVKIENLDNQRINLNSIKQFISEEADEKLTRSRLEENDLLYGIAGSIGTVAIVEHKDLPANTNQALAIIRGYNLAFDKDFLIRVLSSNIASNVNEKARGGAMNNISLTDLGNLVVPLPPLSEQHRIVQKIETLFAEVDELEAKLDKQSKMDARLQLAVNAEVQQAPDNEASKTAWNFITNNFETLYHTPEAIDNLKKNILNEAVRGRLVPQDPNDEPASELLKKIEAEKQRLYEAGEIRKPKALPPVTEEEIPFEIPESWEWCRLPEVGILERGKSKHRPRNDPKLFSDGKYPLIQTGDVSQSAVYINTYTNKYNNVGLAQSKLWKKGTLCITIAANIADTGILNFPACFPDSVVGFQVYSESCHIRFYDFFLQILKENLENIAPSTAQKNINLTILESLATPFPPGEEQHRIVQCIEELFAICDQFKAKLQHRQQVNEKLVKGLVKEVLELS